MYHCYHKFIEEEKETHYYYYFFFPHIVIVIGKKNIKINDKEERPFLAMPVRGL